VDAPGRKNSAATLSFAGRTFVQLLAFPPAHKKSLVGVWRMGRCAVNKRFERRERDGFVFVRVRAGRTDLTERTPEKDSRSQLSIFVALDVSVHSLIRREENLCLVMFSQNMGPIIEIYIKMLVQTYIKGKERSWRGRLEFFLS
jgi:hypothetical protein